jgi:hypothetical protein
MPDENEARLAKRDISPSLRDCTGDEFVKPIEPRKLEVRTWWRRSGKLWFYAYRITGGGREVLAASGVEKWRLEPLTLPPIGAGFGPKHGVSTNEKLIEKAERALQCFRVIGRALLDAGGQADGRKYEVSVWAPVLPGSFEERNHGKYWPLVRDVRNRLYELEQRVGRVKYRLSERTGRVLDGLMDDAEERFAKDETVEWVRTPEGIRVYGKTVDIERVGRIARKLGLDHAAKRGTAGPPHESGDEEKMYG